MVLTHTWFKKIDLFEIKTVETHFIDQMLVGVGMDIGGGLVGFHIHSPPRGMRKSCLSCDLILGQNYLILGQNVEIKSEKILLN